MCLRMESLDLRQIQALVALFEHGSYPKAATSIGVPVATLRTRVHALERRMGQKIVRRNGRGVELTGAGLEVVPMARRAMQLLRTASDTLATGSTCHLLIGAVDLVASWLLVAAARSVLDTVPEIKLTIRVGSPEEVQRLLEDGVVRLAILTGPFARHRFRPVWEAKAPVRAFAAPSVIDDAEELPQLPLALPADHWWLEYRVRQIVGGRTLWHIGPVGAVKELARQGQAVAFLGLGATTPELEAGTLRRVAPVTFRDLTTTVVALIKPDVILQPVEHELIDRLAILALRWLREE
jgi:DNA-binding transcriptional LysR family regulator